MVPDMLEEEKPDKNKEPFREQHHECFVCQKTFATNSSLNRHNVRFHKVQFGANTIFFEKTIKKHLPRKVVVKNLKYVNTVRKHFQISKTLNNM